MQASIKKATGISTHNPLRTHAPVLNAILHAPANHTDDVVDDCLRIVLMEHAAVISVQLGGGGDAAGDGAPRKYLGPHGVAPLQAAVLGHPQAVVLAHWLAGIRTRPAREALVPRAAHLQQEVG